MLLYILTYLLLSPCLGGTTTQAQQSQYPQYFWFSFPEQFKCWNTDGLYIMQEAGKLTHFDFDSNSPVQTILQFQPADGCWHLMATHLTSLKLRNCVQSLPDHPPESYCRVCHSPLFVWSDRSVPRKCPKCAKISVIFNKNRINQKYGYFGTFWMFSWYWAIGSTSLEDDLTGRRHNRKTT